MSVGHFMEEVWDYCRAVFHSRNVWRQPQDWRRVCAILSSHSTWSHCWSEHRVNVKCPTKEFMYLFNISGLWRKNVMLSTWYQQHGSRDSSVGIVTRMGVGPTGNYGSFTGWSRKFFPMRPNQLCGTLSPLGWPDIPFCWTCHLFDRNFACRCTFLKNWYTIFVTFRSYIIDTLIITSLKLVATNFRN